MIMLLIQEFGNHFVKVVIFIMFHGAGLVRSPDSKLIFIEHGWGCIKIGSCWQIIEK